jgi:acyl-coenzyme A thioesterase PaaI-like protein
MTPEERARRSAEAMWAGDRASKWVGMRLDTVGPGFARMSLEVRDEHMNGRDVPGRLAADRGRAFRRGRGGDRCVT